MIAGGLGMVPLRGLLQYLIDVRDLFGRVILLYGTGEPGRILFRVRDRGPGIRPACRPKPPFRLPGPSRRRTGGGGCSWSSGSPSNSTLLDTV